MRARCSSRAFRRTLAGWERVAAPRPDSCDVSPRLIGPAGGSAYSVPRSPPAVRPLRGLPADGFSHALVRMLAPIARLARPWSVRPWSSLPRPRTRDRLSWSFVPYDTRQHGGSGSPGGSTPRHLPSPGFDYPPDGFLSCVPGDGPSAAAASMGFALQGLAPPGQRYPSRGLASPVVCAGSFRRPPATPEVVSGWEGERRAPARTRRPPNLALVGVRPSKAFSCATLVRLPGPSPSCPFGRKCSLPFHFRAGLQGIIVRRNRLASLETAGLPGVLHLSAAQCLFGHSPSRAYCFASARKRASLGRKSGRPEFGTGAPRLRVWLPQPKRK
jgi:hypothetical protein